MILEKRKGDSRQPKMVVALVGTMVVALCILWCMAGTTLLSKAQAQLPNPAVQRLDLVQEVRRTNELLEEIRQLLKSGTLHVRVVGADNQADAPTGSAQSTP